MAEQLKNELLFTLAAGASVVLPHDLQTALGTPLAPDIIFIPPDLEVVSSDDIAVTIRNLGGDSSGVLLVESWHTIERAFGGVQNADLPVKPYIVVMGAGATPEPPFAPGIVIIYARTTGNDTTGTGTLANPYLTMQRAVRDVPPILPPGVQYFIDITGIDETLPDDYTLPAWKAPFSRDFGSNGPYNRYFLSGTAVSIVAVPQPVPGLGADGIIALSDIATVGGVITGASGPATPIVITTSLAHGLTTGDSIAIYGVTGNEEANGLWFVTVTGANTFSLDGSSTIDAYTGGGTVYLISQNPITKLITLTFTAARAALVGVEGKRVIVSSTDNPVGNNLITDVGTLGASISLACAPSFAPQPTDYPLTIMDLSASIHGSGFQIGGALNAMNIDSIGFKGLKIFSDIGFLGLYADGIGDTITELCDLDSPHVFTVCPGPIFGPFNRNFCDHITTFAEFGGATFIVQSLVENLVQFTESFLQSPNKPILVQNVFRNLDQAIEVTSYGPGTGLFFPSTVDDLQLQHILIDGVQGDGLIFHGNRGNIVDVDVKNVTGDGIVMKDGAGVSQLDNCGSSGGNTGFGLAIDDGMQVKADMATTTTLPGAGLALAGTAGEISLGSVGAVTWATVAGTGNVTDYVNPGATGSRISQS